MKDYKGKLRYRSQLQLLKLDIAETGERMSYAEFLVQSEHHSVVELEITYLLGPSARPWAVDAEDHADWIYNYFTYT
jgi:hypothetical protein